MSTFGYHRELGKYEDVDEDELLATLTSEEIQELEGELAVIDPDDNIPIGLRQKDQTAKVSDGNFSREALLKYWEDERLDLLEDHENLGSTPGKDSLETPPDKKEEVHVTESDTTRSYDKKRNAVVKKKCLNNEEGKYVSGLTEKNVNEEEEKKDTCKKEPVPTSDRHGNNVGNVLSRNSEKGPAKKSLRSDTTDHNLNGPLDRPCENPIVIDKALEQCLCDDPAMNELNLNNTEDISQETLLRFAEALSTNTHVRIFSLANTHADDRVAFAISKMLRENRSITNLNVESNYVSGRGVLALLTSLHHNDTLVELRFQNQRHICGGQVEMEMVRLLRDNTTLLKLGYQFDLPGPRMTATSLLTRNQDKQRQKRLQQQREQTPPQTPVKPQEEPALPEKPVKKQKEQNPLKKPVKLQKEPPLLEKPVKQQKEQNPLKKPVKLQKEPPLPEKPVKQQKEPPLLEKPVKQQKEQTPLEKPVKWQKEQTSLEKPVKQKEQTTLERPVKQQKQTPLEKPTKQQKQTPLEKPVKQQKEQTPLERPVNQKKEPVPSETPVKQKEQTPLEKPVKQKERAPLEKPVKQQKEPALLEKPVKPKREPVPSETPVKQRADGAKSLAQESGTTKPAKRSQQKFPGPSQKLVCNDQTLNKVPPPSSPTALRSHSEKNTPTRKIAEMIKQQEGLNGTKGQSGLRKSKSKKGKNDANEKDSADILKDLKNALKPSRQKRKDEPCYPLAPQRSTRDDLMEAIRGSSIRSLKRVNLS